MQIPDFFQGKGSRRFPKARKRYFLQLAARVVSDVDKIREENGVGYARNEIINCGLSLDLNGQWRVEKLFPHLQEIFTRHTEHFKGAPVDGLVVGAA